jgi:hypothetical protein
MYVSSLSVKVVINAYSSTDPRSSQGMVSTIGFTVAVHVKYECYLLFFKMFLLPCVLEQCPLNMRQLRLK